MGKKVLVIGGGAREHALAWKLADSKQVGDVYVAPGNGGSQGKIKNVDIGFDDVDELLKFALGNKIDLSVVGQEAASAAGVVDAFERAGLTIFGPTKAAVRIETSKTYSKDLMAAQHIPTAIYQNFSNPDKARAYAKTRPMPVVIKADGLATGKGVIIAASNEEIDEAIDEIMVDKAFGDSGNKVVVEDFLKGKEASMHALCDGTRTVMFPPSQDHKQVFDGDNGPNTGGMGAFAPVTWITDEQVSFVKDYAVEPALRELKQNGAVFKGCLYPGLMIDGDKIKLLEFNARFGNPEADVYMRLLEGDLYEILTACAKGKLNPAMVKWRSGFAATVVIASGGYPGMYAKGLPITGVDVAQKLDDIVIFHAGTAIKNGKLVTNGGRVIHVTATGSTLDQALDKAYSAVKFIKFKDMHYRRDIGKRTTHT